MKIERVQYDGEGEWLDVHFSDGRAWKLRARWLRYAIDSHNEYYSDEPEPEGLEHGIRELKS